MQRIIVARTAGLRISCHPKTNATVVDPDSVVGVITLTDGETAASLTAAVRSGAKMFALDDEKHPVTDPFHVEPSRAAVVEPATKESAPKAKAKRR